MAKIKLTKTELKTQQSRLSQLDRYLPTLQLKKAMLQAKVQELHLEVALLSKEYQQRKKVVLSYAALLGENVSFDFREMVRVLNIDKRLENVAGVEISILEGLQFDKKEYDLFETPPWADGAISFLKSMLESKIRLDNELAKQSALEKELEDVTIKVNLFEKRLIPEARLNIKKIKIFLGDQQLASIARTKMARTKIMLRASSMRGVE